MLARSRAKRLEAKKEHKSTKLILCLLYGPLVCFFSLFAILFVLGVCVVCFLVDLGGVKREGADSNILLGYLNHSSGLFCYLLVIRMFNTEDPLRYGSVSRYIFYSNSPLNVIHDNI